MKNIEHCKTCGGAYDIRQIKRQFGSHIVGFCSATCFTVNLQLQSKAKEKEKDDIYTAYRGESFPCNPLPFANGLAAHVREHGTDSIKSDDAKRILWVLMAQAYSTVADIDLVDEWARLEKAEAPGKYRIEVNGADAYQGSPVEFAGSLKEARKVRTEMARGTDLPATAITITRVEQAT